VEGGKLFPYIGHCTQCYGYGDIFILAVDQNEATYLREKGRGLCGKCISQNNIRRTTMFNKGRPCPYSPIVCQEGFCNRCYIYLSRMTMLREVKYELEKFRDRMPKIILTES